ncbi:MAG: murein biosynthesis integral membrane protein MurJ [Desulfovibrionaceae bacterium]|nr:murein biosynthesis integral membrane protein MurJ [Desulfovibrionaceae bacterium]
MNVFTRVQRLGPAALLLAASVFVSRFMGLIRDKVISYYFGAGLETDLYNAAFIIPDFINYLLAGGYFSITLIPLLAHYFHQDEADGWAFFSAACAWISLAAFLITGLAWILAPDLARLSAPGFSDPALQARLAHFLRIILPAQACFLPGACFTALLLHRRQFRVPALTPLAYNGGIILTGLFFVYLLPDRGMEGFCWGVLIGAALGSLVLPWLAVRAGGLRLAPRLLHPGMKSFLLLALPLMLGQSIVALDEQLLRFFGSLGQEGSISHLSYARRIMMVPVGVVAQAAGMASFPFLASLAAAGKREEFNRTVNRTLLTSLSLILPISVWMAALSLPIIRLIFQQGIFSAQAAGETAALLAIMLAAASFWAVQQVLGRGFYAHQNTLTPVLAGSIATLAGLPLYWLLTGRLGATGVALAGVAGMGLYTLCLIRLWVKHFGSEALAGIPRRFLIVLALSLSCAMIAASASASILHFLPGRPLIGAFAALCAGSALFAGHLVIFCRLFAPGLWKEALNALRNLRERHI